jgi:hypothetical protein
MSIRKTKAWSTPQFSSIYVGPWAIHLETLPIHGGEDELAVTIENCAVDYDNEHGRPDRLIHTIKNTRQTVALIAKVRKAKKA